MNTIKFNEWSAMGLKKDIERIIKKMDSRESIFLSICVEVAITVGVILVDHLFDTEEVPTVIWIITAAIALFLPFLALVIALYKYFTCVRKVKRGIINTVDFIDTFDNSICYWAMMCRSFCDLLKNNRTSLSNDEKMFYYQESYYYIYKSIFKLDEMKPISKKVFSNNASESIGKHVITINRLEAIVNVLKTVSIELESELQFINSYDSAKSQQKELSDLYNNIMTSFIKKINQEFSCNLSWI